MQDSKIVQMTSKIENLGPVATLYCTASEIRFVEKVAETEAAAQPENQTLTDDDQPKKNTGKTQVSISSSKRKSQGLAC